MTNAQTRTLARMAMSDPSRATAAANLPSLLAAEGAGGLKDQQSSPSRSFRFRLRPLAAACFSIAMLPLSGVQADTTEDEWTSERLVAGEEVWGPGDFFELNRLEIASSGNLRIEERSGSIGEIAVAGGALTLGEWAYSFAGSTEISDRGRLRLEGQSQMEIENLSLSEGVLELRENSEINGIPGEDGSTGGVIHLGEAGRISVEGNSMINMGMVRSEGGTIEIRATPWIEEGFDSDTGESIETVHQGGLFNAEVFHAAKGTTRVILGGGDIPDNLEASVFGSARFRVGDLLIDPDAAMRIELLKGGRFIVGPNEWSNADQLAHTAHPDAGTLVIGTDFLLAGNVAIQVGEVDEGRAGSLSQNLLVARDGVIELDGPNAKLTTGEGTWTHFELGSILWIFPEAVPEVPDEAPDEKPDDPAGDGSASVPDGNDAEETPREPLIADRDAVESLDFSKGKVTGLENLTVYVGTQAETGDLYYGADGKLHILIQPPAFEGPLANLTQAVWLKRKDVFTPQYFRKLFLYTEPEATAANLVRVAGSTAAIGTRERMTADMTMLSGNLSDVVRTLELAGRVPVPVEEDSILRKIPEVMTSIPVMVDASGGRSRTSVPIPDLGLNQTVTSDDTTIRGAFVLGKGDIRFGLYGAFTESDFNRHAEESRLPLTGSSERALVSLFAYVPVEEKRVTMDLTWSEAADKVRVPSAGEFLHAEGVKCSLWSFGLMTECPLFGDLGSTRVDWTVTGLSGARVWKWGDAEALWQAESGDVLKTRESGGYAVSATLGGRIAGSINFAAKGIFEEWLPRRIDGSLNAAVHGLTSDSASMTVTVPGIEGARGALAVADLPKFQMSADAKLGIQFPQTRIELTGSVMKAGSKHRAHSVGARLSWVFNEV